MLTSTRTTTICRRALVPPLYVDEHSYHHYMKTGAPATSVSPRVHVYPIAIYLRSRASSDSATCLHSCGLGIYSYLGMETKARLHIRSSEASVDHLRMKNAAVAAGKVKFATLLRNPFNHVASQYYHCTESGPVSRTLHGSFPVCVTAVAVTTAGWLFLNRQLSVSEQRRAFAWSCICACV